MQKITVQQVPNVIYQTPVQSRRTHIPTLINLVAGTEVEKTAFTPEVLL